MQHEHGDAPGPTTKRDDSSTERAATETRTAAPKAAPGVPTGADEGTGAPVGGEADPVPNKYHNPSAGELSTPSDAPHRGGGYLLIPGEDS